MKMMQERSWQEFQKMAKALKRVHNIRSIQQITEKLLLRCLICRSSSLRFGETRANHPSSMLQMRVSCLHISRALQAHVMQPRIDSSLPSITEPTATLASNLTWQVDISKGQFPLRISNSVSSSTSSSLQGWQRLKSWLKHRAMSKCSRQTTQTRSESAKSSWNAWSGNWRKKRRRRWCTRWKRTIWSTCSSAAWRTCAKRLSGGGWRQR